ncbi:unknown protein [Seminavis robusta]|uniref:Uncharacterized protein n=1 Tax=Seminavis robusta TaxID=568900 RepID=A0A9N8EIL1_9STRA|nr:unknown protein [Seminavis robusta]|eukprot:Sro1138_g245350.1 n/a (114) ;mRNA; f:4743-5084
MKTKKHSPSTKKATTAPAKKAQGSSKSMRPAKQAAVAKLCTKADIMHPVSGSEKQVQANAIAELAAENKRLTTEVNGWKRSCEHYEEECERLASELANAPPAEVSSVSEEESN